MKLSQKIVVLLAAFTLITGCQKAVKAPVESIYTIKGNKLSTLYPVDVKQNSEDVLIQLGANAPLPEITSLDVEGNSIAFNFHFVNNTIVVPGKFEHLRLRHGSDEPVDIFRKEVEK